MKLAIGMAAAMFVAYAATAQTNTAPTASRVSLGLTLDSPGSRGFYSGLLASCTDGN